MIVNINTKKFVQEDNFDKQLPIKSRYNIYLGSLCRLNLQLVDNGVPVVIKDTDRFSFAADFNLLHNDDLLFYADYSKCKVTDAQNGKLQIVFIAKSPKAKQKVITANTSIQVQLTRFTSQGPQVLLVHSLYAQPSVFYGQNCPSVGNPRYYTSDEVSALLSAPNDGYFYGRKGDKWVRLGKIEQQLPQDSDSSSSQLPEDSDSSSSQPQPPPQEKQYMYFGFVTQAIVDKFGMTDYKITNLTKEMLEQAVSYQYMTKAVAATKDLFYIQPPLNTFLVIALPQNSNLVAKRDDLGKYANFQDADGMGTNGGKNNGFKFYGQVVNVAADYGIYIIKE